MNKIKRVFITTLMSIMMILSSLSCVYATSDGVLKVNFISVDNGDCTYIEYRKNNKVYNMLIDGGYYSNYHRDVITTTDPDTYVNTYSNYDKYFMKNKSTNAYDAKKLPMLVLGSDTNPNHVDDYNDYIINSNSTHDYDYIKDQIRDVYNISEKDIPNYTFPDTVSDAEKKYAKKMEAIKEELAKNENDCTRFLKANNVTNINYIINTHPHQDHVAGLISVISNANITYDHLYDNGINYYSGWYTYFKLIAQHNETYRATATHAFDYETITSVSNNKIKLGEDTNAPVFTIVDNGSHESYVTNINSNVSPVGQKTGASLWDTAINNTCIVMRMTYNNHSCLFTGDIQIKRQDAILASSDASLVKNVDVLDAMHHGNSNNDDKDRISDNYSTDFKFYEAAKASIGVVQCGSYHTTYDKPRPKVINDFLRYNSNAVVYNTKAWGNITITFTSTISVSTTKSHTTHTKTVSSQKAAGYHTNGYIKYKACTDCGYPVAEETLPMTHKYDHTAVITAATHYATGVSGNYCACGYLISTDVTPVIAHSVARTVTTTAATLTTTGVKTSYCSCGAVLATTSTSKVKSKTLYKGKKVTLKSGTSGKLKWTSSKKSVATVSSKGVVTAKKAGTTTITLKKNGKKVGTCKITVKNPVLKVSKTSVSIKKGKSKTVTASCAPSGSFTWKSSNKKIATVSNGKITGKKKGTCKVTVKCNGVSKTIKVTVK